MSFLRSAYIHLHVKVPPGALQPPGHLLHVQQASSQDRQCVSRSVLATWKQAIFTAPGLTCRGQCLPREVSQLDKYCSKPVQPLGLTTSRETLFLEVTQFNLQMSLVFSFSWEEAANCSRSMNRGFCKVDYCPLGKWNTFPSSPPPCYCTLTCGQCSWCFKLQLLPARLPETWKSQACGHGEPDRKWHCAAFHGNHT